MADNLENSVVIITSSSLDSQYKNEIGTGFIFYRTNEATYVLTCTHVIEGVGGESSILVAGYPATIEISSDHKGFDLTILKVIHKALTNYPVLKTQNYCHEGISLIISGFYLHSIEKKSDLESIKAVLGKSKYREDRNIAKRVTAWKADIQHGDKLQEGYSGSPAVEQESGIAIGVVTNMDADGRGEVISLEALEVIAPLLIEKLRKENQYIDFRTEVGIDYTKLRNLLSAENWKEADQETNKIILQISKKMGGKHSMPNVLDLPPVEDIIPNFPQTDLFTIDKLWVGYSRGRFGFSVQKRIWKDCLLAVTDSVDPQKLFSENCLTSEMLYALYIEFGKCVGWYEAGKKWLPDKNLYLKLPHYSKEGCLPTFTNPYSFFDFLFAFADNPSIRLYAKLGVARKYIGISVFMEKMFKAFIDREVGDDLDKLGPADMPASLTSMFAYIFLAHDALCV